jgi:hypothetical protein
LDRRKYQVASKKALDFLPSLEWLGRCWIPEATLALRTGL